MGAFLFKPEGWPRELGVNALCLECAQFNIRVEIGSSTPLFFSADLIKLHALNSVRVRDYSLTSRIASRLGSVNILDTRTRKLALQFLQPNINHAISGKGFTLNQGGGGV